MSSAATVPKNEQAILQKLIAIRTRLTALKQDRSTYLRSSDVNTVYEQTLDEVRKINNIRAEPSLHDEQNRVDVVLDDVFQLLSLSFLTVGVRSAPATYASLTTVKRLLDHLKESRVYSNNDLAPIDDRLNEIKGIVERDADSESPEIIQLIRAKISVCETELKELQDSLAVVSHELLPTLQKLVSIRRQIVSVGSRPKFSISELKALQEELRNIENSRVDGNFLSPDGNIPDGQNLLNGLLEDCHDVLNDFFAREDLVAPSLRPIYEQLTEMKNQLDSLMLTHKWTLRETDLYNYQQKLASIDDMRVKGVFVDDNGNTPEGQTILLYLLRRCYALIYRLLVSSEPVSEALIPIQNQLSTVRKCLMEVKRMGGLSSARELYPYQMKLASIDNLRADGKFMIGNQIPEGQGLLNALLAECFDLCHELRVEMDENDQD
ncbi:hypothetical protein POJ06DRAFT_245191 [Lipomyces tetrasporus]|uniref:Uncharacterized protein n=1 Tax=Lipomyces tetrasporus TaxID=54092 RepID=A0AAD7VU12_9ASCO|nr:uncharacterized protein POJ06DRAFT_245191 [Lipomyces tetrasporus]KAJ8102637.1 hypothetical protein POJ06DRAFT_245191 [Lipomyces tetrasporus]